MTELKINPIFRDKIPPLSKEEFEQLEENIVSDGIVREPLVVWNGTIIDGHHRYSIIKKHPEIQYTVREMVFADEWAAIAWMCGNQLGRRNITPAQKTYLLGKLYEARKNSNGGNRGNQYTKMAEDKKYHLPKSSSNTTRKAVAKEQNVNEGTVQKAAYFAQGLDAAEEVSEGFRDSVLSGEIKATKKEIAELRKLDTEDRSKVVDAIKKPNTLKVIRTQRPREEIEKEKEKLRIAERVCKEMRSKTEAPEFTLDDFAEEFSYIADDTVKKLRRMVSIRKQLVSDNAAEVTKLFFDFLENLERITEEF